MGDVVDENVLLVANGRCTHATAACALAAIEYLERCRNDRLLVLDDLGLIFDAYAKHCGYQGGPGVGDQFFVWVHQNIGSLTRVALQRGRDGTFPGFPDDPDLAEFDEDDRVYVATALSADPVARVVNAVDSDYSHHRDALAKAGVDVLELCPRQLKERRQGPTAT